MPLLYILKSWTHSAPERAPKLATCALCHMSTLLGLMASYSELLYIPLVVSMMTNWSVVYQSSLECSSPGDDETVRGPLAAQGTSYTFHVLTIW